jgi:myo-inositol 2-dehydrogenase/D-chiro-inositol 1-dehydrogenase
MSKSKLGICLIGCGRAGMIHGRNFMNKVPGAQIVAVVDAMEDAAKAAAHELGINKWYTDYKKILNDNTIDAVVIACPTNLHRDIVVDCANAKKHIFCEKPMAMNTQECDEMIEVCEKNNVKLQIGFMRRHDPSFKEAKRLLDNGAIGDLVQIHSCTRGPSKPRQWMYDLRKSNGILAEINSHDLDSIRWFAGSEVKELYAIGGNFRNPEAAFEYPDYYDSVLMNGVFENGVQFCIDGAAYVQYGYDSKMEIIGTKGKIQVGRSEANFVKCTTPENGTSVQFIDSWMRLFADAYLAEDISFIQSILNDTEPEVTGKDGREAVRLVEMGNLSIKEKRIIRL